MFKKLRVFFASLLALILAISLSSLSSPAAPKGEPITLGYSNWAGWWPWAIAVDQKMFEKNGVNVQMKWFDGYVQSMETFAAGKIDGNSQTLNDTISFLPGENGGEVVVLVNDNSAGQTKLPTFSTNKISSKSGFIIFSSNFKPPLTIFASRWHALPVVIGTTGIFNFSNLAASRLVVISPSKTAL